MSFKDHQPRVSVIVVNAKGTRQLEECLKSLLQTDYHNFEIIVVDCLTANIAGWLRKFFPEVKLVHFEYDIGASDSHNVEDRADVNSKYLAFLDNDTCVTRDWLKELVKVMETEKNIGMAQAKILTAKDHSLLDHTGIAIDALGTWHTLRGEMEKDFKDTFEIFVASSACCIIQRKAFKDVGGFDPDYFIYDDDTDLSFRTWLLGYKVIFVPSATAIHRGGAARALTGEKLYHSVKNRMVTMLKNYEFGSLWWRFTLYFTLTFLAAISFGFLGKVDESREIFRSLSYPIKNFKKIWSKRMRLQVKRCVSDSELFHRGFLRKDIRPTLWDLRLKWKYFKGE